jgi:nucleoside-diphosphate-sugar epimerase
VSLHVVFGAGQVGSGLARALLARGHAVRVVRRSAAPVGDGIEVVAGDARDATFVRRATEGAAVVYHCMNPAAYTGEAWERELPAMGEALIAAAVAHGARLVVLDNLYGYGEVDGARTEETALAATGRKGRLRAAWDARLRREPGLRFVVGRAGDFFGPGAGEKSLMVPRSGHLLLVGDPDAVHAFSYVPDVVAGLLALGEADGVDGQVFHLPVVEIAPRALATRLGARGWRVPGWAIRLLAPVVPLFRELTETLYQWERPFRVSDAKFRGRFAT